MFHGSDMIRCAGCGVEILLTPVIAGERTYCCEDCAEGRPYLCAERQERDDERRTQSANGSIGTHLQG